MELISKFCDARAILSTDPNSQAWFEICEKLLQDNTVDVLFFLCQEAVKSGDIFALMIEKKYSVGAFKVALELLERMKQRVGTNLDYYLDEKILKKLDKNHKAHHNDNESIEEKIH